MFCDQKENTLTWFNTLLHLGYCLNSPHETIWYMSALFSCSRSIRCTVEDEESHQSFTLSLLVNTMNSFSLRFLCCDTAVVLLLLQIPAMLWLHSHKYDIVFQALWNQLVLHYVSTHNLQELGSKNSKRNNWPNHLFIYSGHGDARSGHAELDLMFLS